MFPNAPAIVVPQKIYGGNETQATPSVNFGSLSLQDALDAANKRKSRKQRYVRTDETLTVGEAQELLAERMSSSRGNGESASKRVQGERRCGRCKETGHNARTCAVEVDSASDSSGSDK